MTELVVPEVFLRSLSATGRMFKLVTTTMIITSLVACAASPAKPVTAEPAEGVKPSITIEFAADMYNSRNYPDALNAFDNIITDKSSSANSRRLAHLGKAMVYLGDDESLHSIENGKMSLISAGGVAPKDNEEFAIETDMLMDAVSEVIGSESKYMVLKGYTNGSYTQLTALQQELDTVEAERDELLAEQITLNEALEKLKQLTLGN
jgi:hypothetical protein